MELAPSLSDAKIENLTDSQGSELPVPNEDTSEIVTNVRVKSGQTLVLGGLFKEDTKIERRQVPGLGDVPILGNAFKGYDDQLKREEIIFLVTPTIVKDDVAKVWADEAEQFASAVRIGSREGLLPWSRDSLTTAQNQQAIDALAKGDRDLAMHHIENSLRLSHNQPEIIRMREELRSGGSAAQADYERSMLQRMIEMKLDDASTDEPAKQSSANPSNSESRAVMGATEISAAETSAADTSSAVASNAALSLDMEPAAETTSTTANAAIELESEMPEEAKSLTFETADFTRFESFSVAPRVPTFLEWRRWTPDYFGEMYWDRIAAISEPDAQ
jgi:hypothetical protein